MKELPIVAIIGRANVGKSSLFNRLVDKPRAVTAREAGTTRDSVVDVVEQGSHAFWLIDTAGFKDPGDEFEASIQDQVRDATASADVLVVVVDSTVMVTDEDRQAAKLALRAGKEVILTLNKRDLRGAQGPDEFRRLGIPNVVTTSATRGEGVEELVEAIARHLPIRKFKRPSDLIRVALVGRPNVGKSSAFNALAKKQIGVVSDRAGTTRDVNSVLVRYHQRDIELLDTAGIRRAGRIELGVEKFSVLRTMHAINTCDIAVLLIDATELATRLDLKIAGLVKDAGKGLIIAVNKWDMLDKDERTEGTALKRLAFEFDFVPWAPVVFTSAETGQNVTKLFELILEIHGNRRKAIPTPQLNNWLQAAQGRHHLSGKRGVQPRLNYAVQNGTEPPSFRIFGAKTELIHWSYKRFLEHSLRDQFDFTGTPLTLEFTSKPPRDKQK